MIEQIKAHLPNHILSESSSQYIYIVDYKNYNLGGVLLHEEKPKEEFKYVFIRNENEITICFDGFFENALEIEIGKYCSQCECLIFPNTCNENDWILFIETKYALDRKAAFENNRDYPYSAIKQIISTVSFFRDKGIIGMTRRVNAIVSFPNLIEEFNSFIFTGDLSIDNIRSEHNIVIRGTNEATIKSIKRIYLTSSTSA